MSHCPAHRVEVLPQGDVSGQVMEGGVKGDEMEEVTGGEVREDLEHHLRG